MYSSITASIAGTVYFDLPDATTIRGVCFAVNPAAGGTAADYVEVEVSLSSSNQTAVHDAQGVVAAASFSTTGGGSPANIVTTGLNASCAANIPCKAGTRVYLNATESGGATWRVRAVVWFD